MLAARRLVAAIRISVSRPKKYPLFSSSNGFKPTYGDKRVENHVDKPHPFYEVTHDAVVPAILSWRKREFEKIEHQAKLEKEIQEKIKLEQKAEEQRKERKKSANL